jgi:alkanesulfonate monooxygenase SsuD/methylene tetrahydromethanopterin reductase-like flavin-dependent oxidoreductase (luciferase family)
MTTASRIYERRRETSPLFNDRKMKLGTFSTNLSGGCAITTIDGVLEVSWPNTLALARLADEMEFEAIVPVGRWRGFGGVTNFNGAGFECFTFASAVGAQTRYPAVFATSHVPTIHPVMAAKQAMTVDHVTNGRFALNIVTGWHKPEIEMFGAPLLEHDLRYDMAVEWLDIIKRLWTQEEEFDFEGKYYRIKRGWLQPKPVSQPYPVVMNAGGSEKGRHFAAKYCDVAFVVFNPADLEGARAHIGAYRKLAREEYGRDIQVWAATYVVQRDTEKEAKDFWHYYIHEKGDWEAVSNLVETLGINAQTLPPEVARSMKEHFIGGWAGYPLVGTNDQIVDELLMLSDIGLDGVLMSWPRYEEEMRRFRDVSMPALRQAGLR